ncbi:MAG TPA: YbaK/EbsC family protein [Candidatus Hydrogenedentes bacterium]|nr:YbaK/EbsC family protein [Candidatus Hydrogenedentota bacterium]HOS03333.1 YbaK/EbsC family protein [Candidatus Hydrogenedentota bacterium]
MPAQKVRQFLDSEGVAYRVVPHERAFTASETAGAARIKARVMAKAVIVQSNARYFMAVLSADRRADLEALRALVAVERLVLADEQEFASLFPGCEIGAMPPFGDLFGMPVFVDAMLREDEEIAFNDGTHSNLIVMAYKEYERIVQPTVGEFAE